MIKFIVLLSIVCLASCEIYMQVGQKSNQNQNQRVLFEEHNATVYGHVDQYTDSNQFFLNTFFNNGDYQSELAISTFDKFIWVPHSDCKNKNVKDTAKSACSTQQYDCPSPVCTGDGQLDKETDKTTNKNFVSLYTFKDQVKVSQYSLGVDTLKFRHYSIPNVPIALVKDMENKGSLKQNGVLGLAYTDSETGTNLLTVMKKSKAIQREEFSFYISDSQSFVTFGINDNYLSKFDFYNYKFDNANLCKNCAVKDSEVYDNKWALEVSTFELEEDDRLDKDKPLADQFKAQTGVPAKTTDVETKEKTYTEKSDLYTKAQKKNEDTRKKGLTVSAADKKAEDDAKTAMTTAKDALVLARKALEDIKNDEIVKSTGVYSPQTSRFVFDSTLHGYSFSADRFTFLKTNVIENFPKVSDCKDTEKAENLDGDNVHFKCKCGEDLTNLPTFKFTFKGQKKVDEKAEKDQVWFLKPENYASKDKDGLCEIFFYSRAKVTAATVVAVGSKQSALSEIDDHIFAGRLFTRFFFTSFDQEDKLIKLSTAWHDPDPFMLSDATMILVLVLGVIAIVVIFAATNAVLKPLPKRAPVQQRKIVQPVQASYQPAPLYYSQQQASPVMVSQQPIYQQQVPTQLMGSQGQYVQFK